MSFQFLGQQPGEEVRLFTRRHPFVLLLSVFYSVLVLWIAVAAFALAANGMVVFCLTVASLLIAMYILFSAWFGWYRSVLLLTNLRMIYVHQRGFFSREMTELRLNDIVQISNSVNGILETVSNTGSLTLASSSSHQALIVSALPDAAAIQRAVLEVKGL